MGLTTYMYAPKDDYKHRLQWREKYAPEETGNVWKNQKSKNVYKFAISWNKFCNEKKNTCISL